MAVSSDDFLLCATDVLSFNESEINSRTVISRAYYSVYHVCNKFHDSLPSPGRMVGNATGTHETLLRKLANPNVERTDPLFFKSRSISHMTRLLKDKRVIADYELNASVSKNQASQAIEDAKKIIELVEK